MYLIIEYLKDQTETKNTLNISNDDCSKTKEQF